MTHGEERRALVAGTVVGVLSGAAVLVSADASAAATALGPPMTAALSTVLWKLGTRRRSHAEETLTDAAKSASVPIEEFLEMAVSDERSQELLARTLTIAQDTAMRDKRRALGRALAAGVGGDSARVDEELIFIRAVADLDPVHIRLLTLLATDTPQPHGSGPAWRTREIEGRDPGLREVLPVLLATLELHGLINHQGKGYPLTTRGQHFLSRLTDVQEVSSTGHDLT